MADHEKESFSHPYEFEGRIDMHLARIYLEEGPGLRLLWKGDQRKARFRLVEIDGVMEEPVTK